MDFSLKTVLDFLKENSPRALAVHLLLVGGVAAAIIAFWLYVYLPQVTLHKESITVPNLQGMTIDEVKKLLSSMNLRYEVYDSNASNFTVEQPPLTVISHNPTPFSKVKLNRMIYLTINPHNPPEVELPNIIDGSIKNAQIHLKNRGLILGNIERVPDKYSGTVLRLKVKDKEIDKTNFQNKTGIKVIKGTTVDLVVGDGVGDTMVDVPDLHDLPEDEAKQLIVGMSLTVGKITYEPSDKPVGTVIGQKPDARETKKLRSGELVHLLIAGYYPDTTKDEDE